MLHNWRLMTEALADEQQGEERGALGTTHLAMLLAAAARRAAEGPADKKLPRGRFGGAAARDAMGQELTAHMMTALPPLVRKFQADGQTVSSGWRMPCLYYL